MIQILQVPSECGPSNLVILGLGISQFANHLANGIKIAPTMLKKMVQLRLLESSKCKLLFD